jgi:hypothetical protein
MKFFDQLNDLVKGQQETNSLLRELIQALTNRPPATPRPNLKPLRQYTADDVMIVSKVRRERLETPPHRYPIPANGPGSETTSPSDGLRSNGADEKSRTTDPPKM